jgi:hypothetical protein
MRRRVLATFELEIARDIATTAKIAHQQLHIFLPGSLLELKTQPIDFAVKESTGVGISSQYDASIRRNEQGRRCVRKTSASAVSTDRGPGEITWSSQQQTVERLLLHKLRKQIVSSQDFGATIRVDDLNFSR